MERISYGNNSTSAKGVYPHPRGAAHGISYRKVGKYGISPPAWGSLCPGQSREGRQGYIPTRVGQPYEGLYKRRTDGVYPHPRGAAPAMQASTSMLWGISPPAWGSQRCSINSLSILGYIPTRVGQPAHSFTFTPIPEVYPHPRGAATAPA